MSAFNLLTCSASCLARISLRQTHRTITGCLPTGVSSLNRNFSSSVRRQHSLTYPINCELRFLAANPSVSVNGLTQYSSSYFSTNVPTSSEKTKVNTKNPETPVVDATNVDDLIFGEASKLSQFAKFKLMYKKYWYVLIPVHVGSSIGWVVGFYYLSKSGVDIPAMLQYLHLSETIIDKIKHSDMGHYAIAYLCYKVVTPIRYAFSLGLTTLSIKRLVLAGYIKPMPTKKEFIQMYEQKKADRAKRKDDEAAKSS